MLYSWLTQHSIWWTTFWLYGLSVLCAAYLTLKAFLLAREEQGELYAKQILKQLIAMMKESPKPGYYIPPLFATETDDAS